MPRPISLVSALATTGTVLGLLAAGPTAAAQDVPGANPTARAVLDQQPSATRYVNPVSKPFADTFADPSVIRAKDGWWYAYGTTDPLKEGEGQRHIIPMAKSRDLVHWTYVGDVFAEGHLPAWAAADAALWAPDIRYIDGAYHLYYVVTQTTVTSEANDNAIGVATAPTPTGPWTDSGAPVVAPRHGPGGSGDFEWTFDPTHVRASDGRQYLFYGSYYGGIWVTELNSDGTRSVGDATMVAIDNKYEGAYVVRHGGYWYLFASSANCCAGPVTGYSVHVGRSRDLRGPYVDREGVRLDVSRAGGTPVIAPNGNRWVGTGHNAIATDLTGQDWFVYHAIPRGDPYLDEPFGINERPMLVDRLDWVDGWPTVRAGRWASDGPERGPVTRARTATTFDDGGPAFARTGRWTRHTSSQSGAYLRTASDSTATLLTRSPDAQGVRAEADLQVPGGAASVGVGSSANAVTATLDATHRRLLVRAWTSGRMAATGSAPVPHGFDLRKWNNLALTVDEGHARAELTEGRLNDGVVVDVRLPGTLRTAGAGGVVAHGTGVAVDNLSVVGTGQRVTHVVALPPLGRLDRAASDEFNGSALAPGWTTVRHPQVSVASGSLRWPVENADLGGAGGSASVLLRNPPSGNWTIETKVTLDLGVDVFRNYQQAGLIAYVDDDLWTRLSHVAIWNTRQTEFGTERTFAGQPVYGGTIVGPPAPTTWLRIAQTVDRSSGERKLQALTSRDGRAWSRGGVWTLPAGANVRVGLISHGGQGEPEPATARFDYFRLYRPAGS